MRNCGAFSLFFHSISPVFSNQAGYLCAVPEKFVWSRMSPGWISPRLATGFPLRVMRNRRRSAPGSCAYSLIDWIDLGFSTSRCWRITPSTMAFSVAFSPIGISMLPPVVFFMVMNFVSLALMSCSIGFSSSMMVSTMRSKRVFSIRVASSSTPFIHSATFRTAVSSARRRVPLCWVLRMMFISRPVLTASPPQTSLSFDAALYWSADSARVGIPFSASRLSMWRAKVPPSSESFAMLARYRRTIAPGIRVVANSPPRWVNARRKPLSPGVMRSSSWRIRLPMRANGSRNCCGVYEPSGIALTSWPIFSANALVFAGRLGALSRRSSDVSMSEKNAARDTAACWLGRFSIAFLSAPNASSSLLRVREASLPDRVLVNAANSSSPAGLATSTPFLASCSRAATCFSKVIATNPLASSSSSSVIPRPERTFVATRRLNSAFRASSSWRVAALVRSSMVNFWPLALNSLRRMSCATLSSIWNSFWAYARSSSATISSRLTFLLLRTPIQSSRLRALMPILPSSSISRWSRICPVASTASSTTSRRVVEAFPVSPFRSAAVNENIELFMLSGCAVIGLNSWRATSITRFRSRDATVSWLRMYLIRDARSAGDTPESRIIWPVI